RTADWVNLRNLWTLRNCVRENYNHGIGMNDLIFGENFDGDNLDTLTPLTKKRFDFLCKRIKELDPYATI
ncbi:exo-poly-alpha-D-galacturonosidase, partial [Bacteroides fragilis]